MALWLRTLEISRPEGIAGLVLLGLFLATSIGAPNGNRSKTVRMGTFKRPSSGPNALRVLLVGALLLGTSGLYFGSEAFVDGARRLALDFGVSDRVVGLTVVAFGTSVPELVASGIAALRGQADLAIGNVVGSNLFNLLPRAGLHGHPHPLPLEANVLEWDWMWVIGTAAALIPLTLLGGLRTPCLGRWQGGLFLLAYLAYIAGTDGVTLLQPGQARCRHWPGLLASASLDDWMARIPVAAEPDHGVRQNLR